MMQATEFEFRNRWWVFAAIFFAAFLQFAYDHVPLGVRIADGLQARVNWRADMAARIVFYVAAGIMLLAALVRTWGSAYLGREVVHDAAVHSEHLAADGPYRHTRNPIYLGNILMAIAMAAVAPRWGALLMVIALPLFCYRLIGREEMQLEAEQGERYREFKRAVPRLWPALRARIPQSGAQPDWVSGMASEAFFWSFALGQVLFAVTLNVIFLYGGFVASPVLSWLAGMAVRGREKRKSAAV